MFFTLVALLCSLLAYYLYKKGYENEHHFRDRGLKSIPSKWFFGSLTEVLRGKDSTFNFVRTLYERHQTEKAFGLLDMRSPTLFVKDPDILKLLVVKEFDHFMDHRKFIDETMDSLVGNSLFLLEGQKWRGMRSTLSPAFTGSKMRLMYQLVLEVSEQLVDYLRKESEAREMAEYEMKDLCSRFTNDVIAQCAFGIKVDSLKDKDNDFYAHGIDMMNFSKPSNAWKIIAFRIVPKLLQYFKVTFINTKLRNFFKNMILDNMKERKRTQLIRHDMINLLLEVRKGTLNHHQDNNVDLDSAGFATVQESDVGLKTHKRIWTDDELVAQCFLFFIAGFDTSSALMSFTIYELTTNPDVQVKLYKEIVETHQRLNEKKLTYEVLQKMKYIDMVVSETLKKWPPLAATDRLCVKDLDFNDGNGFSYKFEKGTSIWIPIVGLHYDPQYFPNPEKFDPERFSEENKHLINPDTYMPFGVGPRNCIGSRFALLEVKSLLYHIVLNFSLIPIEKTQHPMQLKKWVGTLTSKKGVWVGLKKRE